jgi:DNA polymerase III delta subunit
MAAKPNIHLFVGEDSYLVEAAARRVVEAAVPAELRATAVETVSGEADNMDAQLASLRECTASIQTPPFLDPVKLTWWRGVTFLPGGGVGGRLAEDVKVALEKFAEGLAASPLPDNQVLVITAPKLLMTSIFAKRLKTIAHVVEFGGGGKAKDRIQDALLRLPDLADDEKLTFAPGADQAFLAKVGSDTRTIVSELQKMRAYLGTERNEVTEADVAAVTSVGGDEPELWAIHDAVAQRSPAALLKAVAPYEKDGAGILISTVMEKYFREALVCRDALDRGWLDKWGRWSDKIPPAARAALDAAGFGPTTAKSPWAVKNAVKRALPFTMTELRVARYRMLTAREKLVSSDADDALVVSELLRSISKPRKR